MAFFPCSNSDGASSSSSSSQPRHAFAAPQRQDTPHSDDQHRSPFISQAGHAFPAPQRQDTPHSDIVAAQADSPFGRVRFTNLKKMARSRHSSNTVEQDTPPQSFSSAKARRKRTRSPGIRVRGSIIFDSKNGRTCHQCHNKTREFVASCKSDTKLEPCRTMYCLRCLSNRYGENAKAAVQLNDWRCPKCRGICNCSLCRYEAGLQPVGIQAQTAKRAGFRSVSDMLAFYGPENIREAVNRIKSKESISASNGREDVAISAQEKDDEEHQSVESTRRAERDDQEKSRSSTAATLGIVKTVSSRIDVLSALLPQRRVNYHSSVSSTQGRES